MPDKSAYDVVIAISNDLNSDQRMMRIAGSLIKSNRNVLLIGNENNFSIALETQAYDQVRIKSIFTKGVKLYAEYNIRLFWKLLFIRTRLIYAVDLDTILAVKIAATLKGLKYIFDAHEFFSEVPELQDKNMKKRIWGIIGKFSVPGASLCLTVGDKLASILKNKYSNTFHTIRNLPIYRPILSYRNNDNTFVIIYIGKINLGRGIKELILAMEQLEGAELWLVGDGDLYKKYLTFCTKLSYAHRIKFYGWMRPEQLQHIISRANLGVNLLDSASQSYYYSLANKFFDYVMAGIPVLTMNFPEYNKINKEFKVAVLIDNLKLNSITAPIKKLMKDKKIAEEMKSNCLKARQLYKWEIEECKLIQLFNHLDQGS